MGQSVLSYLIGRSIPLVLRREKMLGLFLCASHIGRQGFRARGGKMATIVSRSLGLRACLGTLVACLALQANATIIDVAINTGALAGTDAQISFDMIDGDFQVNNLAIIRDFASDGTLGSPDPTGGVTGNLPDPVVVDDSDPFFNSLLQQITLRTTISFSLELTENFATGGIGPDTFSVTLFDDQLFPLFETTDPLLQDALFSIDIDGTGSGELMTYSVVAGGPSVTWSASIRMPATADEPGGLALVLMGLLGLIGVRRLRSDPRPT